MNKLFAVPVLALCAIVSAAFVLAGCGQRSPIRPYDHEAGTWIPTVANLDAFPYRKTLMVTDPTGQHTFSIDLRSFDAALIEDIEPRNFQVDVLPAEPGGLDPGAPEAGVGIDGRLYAHSQLSFGRRPTGPPKLFFKVHYEGGEEPPRFRLTPVRLPVAEYAAVVNAGHYKSIVLRRSGSGSSYVQFYHHHGDWNVHLLYQGWFSRCTYAYDCYPNHSIPSWRTSRGDESIEFREDCYGRCP